MACKLLRTFAICVLLNFYSLPLRGQIEIFDAINISSDFKTIFGITNFIDSDKLIVAYDRSKGAVVGKIDKINDLNFASFDTFSQNIFAVRVYNGKYSLLKYNKFLKPLGEIQVSGEVRSIATRNNTVWLGTTSGKVLIVSFIKSGKVTGELHDTSAATRISVSEDGKYLAVGAIDHVSIWRLSSGKLHAMHRITIPSRLAFSPDSKLLVISDMKLKITVANIKRKRIESQYKHPPYPVSALACDADKKYVIFACSDGSIYSINMAIRNKKQGSTKLIGSHCSLPTILSLISSSRTVLSLGGRTIQAWRY